MSATFGDCKNDNRGLHNGYDCPSDGAGNPPPPVVDTIDAGTVLSF